VVDQSRERLPSIKRVYRSVGIYQRGQSARQPLRYLTFLLGAVDMPDKSERWVELAELAANEQDPEKVFALAREISQLLERKQTSFKDGQTDPRN
jgi:hypothetical protein